MREKREQEKENSEAPQRDRKKKSDTPERKNDTHEREREIILMSRIMSVSEHLFWTYKAFLANPNPPPTRHQNQNLEEVKRTYLP